MMTRKNRTIDERLAKVPSETSKRRRMSLGSSQGAQLEVYTLHSLLHAIQQRLTIVVMLFCGG
jgi:hypothetical protein